MYLECPVTIQENTCILIFCMYFTRIPNESKIHFGIHITCEIHYDTCILGASLVSHWIHVRIHQDTCILDSSSRYIRIHRDTKSRYVYLGRVMTNICGIHARIYAGYMRDTCEIHVSSVVIKIHAGHMRDTCGIHAEYMQDTYLGVGGMFRCHHHSQSDRYKCILMYLDVS